MIKYIKDLKVTLGFLCVYNYQVTSELYFIYMNCSVLLLIFACLILTLLDSYYA